MSPFLHLPTPTPLPYSYKTLPSTLPPSILAPGGSGGAAAPGTSTSTSTPGPPQDPAPYLPTPAGPPTHPSALLSTYHALQAHLAELPQKAQQTLQQWEDELRARDLAEKRRVAPGWLDADVRLLKPENVDSAGRRKKASGETDVGGGARTEATGEVKDGMDEENVGRGEELDRVFGTLKV